MSKILLTKIYFTYYHLFAFEFCSPTHARVYFWFCCCSFFVIQATFLHIIVIILKPNETIFFFFALLDLENACFFWPVFVFLNIWLEIWMNKLAHTRDRKTHFVELFEVVRLFSSCVCYTKYAPTTTIYKTNANKINNCALCISFHR